MTATSRADLHVHSTASQLSKLGVQRALGLPECATPPREVYALARRRGMDFVTICDHDTIVDALQIADCPGTFISVELTVGFCAEAQAVHVRAGLESVRARTWERAMGQLARGYRRALGATAAEARRAA